MLTDTFQLENYQKPTNNDSHGYDGPIAISNGGCISALAQDFLRASDAVGIPCSDDIQGTPPSSPLPISSYLSFRSLLGPQL